MEKVPLGGKNKVAENEKVGPFTGGRGTAPGSNKFICNTIFHQALLSLAGIQ